MSLHKANESYYKKQKVIIPHKPVERLQKSPEGSPTILTDLKQLEGKTVILIDFDIHDYDLTLFYTSDHCLLVQDLTAHSDMGGYNIRVKCITDIEVIYDLYEDELVDFGVISYDESQQLENKRTESILTKRKEFTRNNRYKQYLKLKEEFG